ncbi:MAG: AMP-binding protein [Terriglobales bacterium]
MAEIAPRRSYAHGTGDIPLLGCCLGELLDSAARSYPDQDALVVRHENRRYTYRQFHEEVEIVARGLLRMGIQKEDRVGIWATNCAEWVITQFATAKIGAILVNINPANRAFELEYVLRQSECGTLLLIQGFRDADYVSTVNGLCPELASSKPGTLHSASLPHLRNLVFIAGGQPAGMFSWDNLRAMGRDLPQEDLRQREATLSFDDPINIQYTSGTTGFPKGATLSHHNVANNALLIAAAMKLTHRDRLCIPVPFYHCFGMVLSNLACVVTGAAMVIPAAFFDPLATLEAIQAERCTALHGVPTMFIAELDHPEFARFDLSTLRTGVMAGAPCPIEVMKRVVQFMHLKEMTIAYGLTEASPVITQTIVDDPLELRVTTVGKPLPHTEVKIVDVITGEIVPRGTPGELCTRGYMVMKGYFKNPEATRKAIDEDGWLHSGDLATMDANDYCKITGRAKDVIIRGGENIYPREIEEFLYTCPGISDVHVVGVPDEKYGEQVVAWVRLEADAKLSPEDIRKFCEGKIAAYKIPKCVKIVDSFPMTVTGKIQKFKMRELSTKELGLEAVAKIETA